MPGVRVYQLAKELRVQSALIVELLDRLGKEVHSDLSSIDDVTASLVRERLSVALAVEKKRLLDEKRTDDDSSAVASPTDTPPEPPTTAVELEPVTASEAAPESEVDADHATSAQIAAAQPAETTRPAPTATPPAPGSTAAPRPRVFAAKRLVPKMVPPRTSSTAGG